MGMLHEGCVGNGAQQHLQVGLGPATRARQERDGGHDISSGAVADQRDMRGIEPDGLTLVLDPGECGVRLLERGGISRLWRTAVVHEHDGSFCAMRNLANKAIVRVFPPGHPAPAVNEHDDGKRTVLPAEGLTIRMLMSRPRL
jgi:hypothetical protein